MSSGGLSEQQRQRIEESRKRALALRAAKCALPQNATVPACLSLPKYQPTAAQPRPSFLNKGPARPSLPVLTHPMSSVPTSSSFYGSKEKKCYAAVSQKKLSVDCRSKDASCQILVTLTGECVLLSRTRFRVEIGYHSALIDLFKTMETKQYDTQNKRWSFDLSEYTELMKKMKKVAGIQVNPLCSAVRSAFADRIKGRTADGAQSIPDADLSSVEGKLVATLMNFQRESVNFAISRGGRVLIADDMGLGKTIQAICIASYYRSEWPLLIVAPSSVRFAWREQLLRWLPSLDPQGINVVVKGRDSTTSGLINITSYDLMAKQQNELMAHGFKVIVMDESHLLKNGKTARSKAASPLLKKAKRVILLSGTPALSRPAELYVQIASVDKKMFPNFHDFGLRYCAAKQLPWGWDYSGSSNMTELQCVLEERIMIRRMKKDVIKELPEKCRQMVVLDPGSVKVNKGMKASHSLVEKTRGTDRKGALLDYFHETGTAKIPAVREYVLDLLEADRKLLIFAHHQVVLDAIEDAVRKNHACVRIDGRTCAEDRQRECDRFQSSSDVRAAILSITAASCGLNLTSASVVIFAELFWNPGILMQAEDRAHRIGQRDSVNIQYLVATGTADDYIWPLVQHKLDVLGKAGLSKENFTEAGTMHVKSSKQKDIDDYFAACLFDEEMEEVQEEQHAGKQNEDESACLLQSDWLDDDDDNDVWDDFGDVAEAEDEWPPKRRKLDH